MQRYLHCGGYIKYLMVLIINMKIYKAGQYANYNGRSYRIMHVTINGYKLSVSLDGITGAVDSRYVEVEETQVNLNRIPIHGFLSN